MMPSLRKHSDCALLLLRLALGAVFIYHGMMKWSMEDPNTVMTILKFAEPLGGIALILGVLTQLAGLGLAIIMLGAIYNKATGFGQASFDLFGTFGSWEFDMMNLVVALALVVYGAGRYSLDALIWKKS